MRGNAASLFTADSSKITKDFFGQGGVEIRGNNKLTFRQAEWAGGSSRRAWPENCQQTGATLRKLVRLARDNAAVINVDLNG